MGLQSKEVDRRRKGKAIAMAGPLSLLLAGLVLGCSPFQSSRISTILPGEAAHFVFVFPDGQRILHAGPSHPESLLNVATGQDVPIPEGLGATLLDNELLFGEKDLAGVRHYYVVNLQPLTAVKLEPLPGGAEALPENIRRADSIYAIKTGTEKYRLLLLERDPSRVVTAGYYVGATGNLDMLLSGVPYKTPPPYPRCPLDEKVPSPDGQYYYYVHTGLDIYSEQGELLNSISGRYLRCYGWAWDSSGVYVQERNVGLGGAIIGPLQLLLAEP